MAGNSSKAGRSVVSKAIAILAVFSGHRVEAGLSEIARLTQLPTSTTHRLLADLVDSGALDRTPSGRYVIGLNLWGIASRAPQSYTLSQAAVPYLQRLLEVSKEHVHLVTLHGSYGLVLEKLSWHSVPDRISPEGTKLPLHASATGQVLLAFGSASTRDMVLSGPLTAYTPRTLVTADDLRRRLQIVRRQGCSRSYGELVSAQTALAAPVFGVDGTLVGSIGTIVGNDERDLETIERAVRQEASNLTQYLQSVPPDHRDTPNFRPMPHTLTATPPSSECPATD
ncbi:IclR family transcriptional regulator [Paeniglutamicibacter sp. MACA_103]|uniref:IclR family transcriptional regulator n=1 Tax=Paeniglutamicibacter sp. MACA_103 TaxID=3377337 RepID=UPI0038931F3A